MNGRVTTRPRRGSTRARRGGTDPSSKPATATPFVARRRRLARRMRGSGAVAVFVAGREARRNGDVDYTFRQLSTFYYLTGFEEPDAVAVLRPGHSEEYVLFVRPFDPQIAIWTGDRAGVDGALERYGADAAYPIDELDERLPELLEETDTLYFALGSERQGGRGGRIERLVSRIVATRRAMAQRGATPIGAVLDPQPLVDELRLVKSRDEVAALRSAIDITGWGIEAAMSATRPGMHEYEVQAVLEAEYRRLGSPRNGFPSIVATGSNACTLHYTDNRAEIGPSDLLLLDTGAEVDYYGADVSRTFPASGRFTAAQRDVYDIVLEAQQNAIDLVAPGVRFSEVHERAVRTLILGLRDLGILKGQPAKLTKDGAYGPYYMHATSHWLGMDVHDVGDYREDGESIALRPGMVLTVEPGLYLAPGLRGVPRRLRGIGVRIEDDILVTRSGHENLSEAIPRDPAVLEEIAGSAAEYTE